MADIALLEEFLRNPPDLHGDGEEAIYLGLDPALLRWFGRTLDASAATLETGCGASTITFAILGTDHTVISPFAAEHDRIKGWCAGHGIATEQIRFIAEGSETALPALDPGPLDLVLIDGNHSFPLPFIDWFYTADRLRSGGFMAIDDMHIRPCAVLRDFMDREKGRWERAASFKRSVVFRKVAEKAHLAERFWDQPWSVRPWNVKEFAAQLAGNTIRRSPRLRKAASRLRDSLFSAGRA